MQTEDRVRLTCQNRFAAATAITLFVLGLTATALRVVIQYQTPGPFNASAQGMCDFHNGIYFPTRALLAGVSPYGQWYANEYPVARQIPFFSPAVLVLHAPLAILPLHLAEVVYFLFSSVLIVVIAAYCATAAGVGGRLEWIAGISALMVFSRGGHITLFDGYFTLELVLATFVAISLAKHRPMIAALALVIVSAKPTFILPLGFLLLARRNHSALLVGAGLSVLAAVLPLAWLAYHEGLRVGGVVDFAAGFEKLVADIRGAQEVHLNMDDESPVLSWTRLDLLAIVCKWGGREPGQAAHLAVMALMLAWPMLILFRRARLDIDDGLSGATGSLIVVTLLSSLYHQSYDALLLIAPLAGLMVGKMEFWRAMPDRRRWLIGGLMLIPLLNYLSTRAVLGRLSSSEAVYRVLTSVNGVALALCFGVLCWQLAIGGTRADARSNPTIP